MKRILLSIIAPLAIVALGGCHAKTVQGQGPKTGKDAQESQGSQASNVKVRVINSERPVRTTPGGFFNPTAVKKIQWALGDKGHKVAATGKLDGATTKALIRFQEEKKQPATGYPDFGTLRMLGLSPQEIYVHGRDPKAVEKGDEARDKATRDIKVTEEFKD